MSVPQKLLIGAIGFAAILSLSAALADKASYTWFFFSIGALAGLSTFFRFSKKQKIQNTPFKPQWRAILKEEVPFYTELSIADKAIFEERVKTFFSDVDITGVGFEIDDTCRLLVAASAIVPFWELPFWNYGDLHEVLVYPDAFDHDYQIDKDHHILGMVGSGRNMDHVMILSKKALYMGFENLTNKSHVGFHEFAHLLDKSDGSIDGVPRSFLPDELVNPWTKLVHREMKKIRNQESDINPYGATNESEFFAVVSEYFQKRPDLMKRKHPDLYKMLSLIYHREHNT
ncbi:M90 family metallopeptidase [Roseivirga pacifica]|uniref:M90 family metallopeptidase n=1 Tax=Roseivirga pacifica TaxID=1267423 RepID=UPI00227B2D86|nr:M90 family metallopeptidase [Roseivirga pacifica]